MRASILLAVVLPALASASFAQVGDVALEGLHPLVARGRQHGRAGPSRLAERASSENPDSSEGTLLYITSPACGHFRCVVDWYAGETVLVNWVNPPPRGGNVSISLASNNGGPAYPIVDSYPAVSQEGYCDAGSGVGVVVPGVACGAYSFAVPSGWEAGANYTIVLTSLISPTDIGYTDAITLHPSNTTTAPIVSTDTVPVAVAIAAPTSTNVAGSVEATVAQPAPTAVAAGTSSVVAPATVANSTGVAVPAATTSATATVASAAAVVPQNATATSAAPAATISKAAAVALYAQQPVALLLGLVGAALAVL